ncbi:MAG: hypothetical protein M1820_005676 [Bogoriella megaspora]|nr:MAG: hypothetical protein M1820_005676 [Bogoriella megaspora]
MSSPETKMRIGRPCDYESAPTHSVDRDDFDSLQQKVLDLESRLLVAQTSTTASSLENGSANGSVINGTTVTTPSAFSAPTFTNSSRYRGSPGAVPGPSPFPSLFFLDSHDFTYGRFTVQRPHMTVPQDILDLIGDHAATMDLLEKYFANTHRWMPIVSKMRIYQLLSNPLIDKGADIALLLLAVKLLTQPSPPTPLSHLYQIVKSFLASVEYNNAYSINVIQAAILIALYELGNAIYPAAYLTIGHCARMGHAMGLHTKKEKTPQMLPRCTTWTEQEERRRIWWAVVVLDRFVNLGNAHRPFATEDPSLETNLPSDDKNWDKGEMVGNDLLLVSSSTQIRASPFARTCQAAHLLGKVLHHINDVEMELDFRFEQANQLNRTVRALATLIPDEACEENIANGPTLCSCMAICYSALLILYETYSCTENKIPRKTAAHLEIQDSAVNGIKEISGEVLKLCRRFRTFIDAYGLARVSPLVADCMYQAAANYAWYVRESAGQEYLAKLQEIKSMFETLEPQWKVAGEYLKIVEATEFNMAGGCP